MAKGKHIIIDAMDVPFEICMNDKFVLKCMAEAAEESGSNVISQVRYKFNEDTPPGFTSVVLLDESHVSCHTYANLGLMALDIFTCGTTDPENVFEKIKNKLNLKNYSIKIIDRFTTNTNGEIR